MYYFRHGVLLNGFVNILLLVIEGYFVAEVLDELRNEKPNRLQTNSIETQGDIRRYDPRRMNQSCRPTRNSGVSTFYC